MSAAIEVHGLVKRYGALTAVDGIDLEISRGECYGLLGPNGAGKTTTVEVLEGLHAPTAGEVRILGAHWGENDDDLRQRLGVALQETQLADKLTVFETLRLFSSFYRVGRPPEEVIAAVELREKRDVWVSKLSGGQKQRLAIACALVGDPDVLFLDEPTTGLDPQSRRQIWELVMGFKRGGKTVVLTTHYMDEAERLCDRVAVVDHGKIIAQGTPNELIARLGGDQVIEIKTEPMLSAETWTAIPGVRETNLTADRWRLTVTALHETLPAVVERVAARGASLTGLATHRASLEDVFVNLTGRSLRDG